MANSTMELRGFVMFVLSISTGVMFLTIGLVPTSVFHRFGLYYVPDPYLAMAVSIAFMIVSPYVMFAVELRGYRTSPALSAVEIVTDSYYTAGKLDSPGDDCLTAVPTAHDVSITTINKLLFYND